MHFIQNSLLSGGDGDVDLGVIIDGTSTVRTTNPRDGSYDNWEIQLDFVATLIGHLPNGTRVGAIVLKTRPRVAFYLNDFSDLKDAAAAVRKLKYPDTASNTAAVLHIARVSLFNETNGDRPNAPNVLILITDGGSSFQKNRTIPNAEALHRLGTTVVGIGVGNKTHKAELQAISSPPHEENVNFFLRDRFQDLHRLVDVLLRIITSLSGKHDL